MKEIYLNFVIILTLAAMLCYCEFRQERAKVKYCNPKYMTDCVMFTGRKNRNEPYRTNMTGTILMPFGNNVSIVLILQMKSGGDFRVVTKLCETLKAKWMRDFTARYTNITLTQCPIKQGRYRYYNMELPPKNVPIPIADGDYYVGMEMFITETKEPICEVVTFLHFEQNKKPKKDKRGKGMH